ncbi:MAG: helix-turn-helix transcriptional regulator [Candidatus Dadabacteria bacterium]|nr:helix-turn-helix transcriptional regulator [Candidatus Dadabacteria bacterium]MDE0663864.1 helix-turn-helix transcriptional regulator [Candidatus Dadabacteria bacterium]
MVLLFTLSKAQETIAANMRNRRLATGLTQQGLAKRSGVSLATLRKFEQKGVVSLESFLKLAMVLDALEDIVKASESPTPAYSSINEVIEEKSRKPRRKRGWRE